MVWSGWSNSSYRGGEVRSEMETASVFSDVVDPGDP
jgi:hypothetical protein